LRWYGSKFDTVTLKQIRQIPGVKGVITTGAGRGLEPGENPGHEGRGGGCGASRSGD
jgi:hypothetical protein